MAVITPTPDRIPEALKALDRWLVWKGVEEGGKLQKKPHDHRRGILCNAHDGSKWSSFKDISAAHAGGGWDGIGIKPGGGIVALDLDKCRDPQTGAIEPWAQEVIDRLNSYTEVSPSGTGIRVFVRGVAPGPDVKRGKAKAELHSEDHGNYVTVTGHMLPGSPAEIVENQAGLDWYYSAHIKGEEPAAAPVATGAGESRLPDDEVLAAIRASHQAEKFSALYDDGSLSAHGEDWSAADMALMTMLAWWTGSDPEQMERLFDGSALALRDKWQDRDDYRGRTIAAAIRKNAGACFHRQETPFQPVAGRNPFAVDPEALRCSGGFATSEPPAREFLWRGAGGLSRGIVGLFAGQGGAGKSELALQIAVSIACGRDMTGGLFQFSGPGAPVLAVFAEDDRAEVERRTWAIRKHFEPTTGPLNLDDLFIVGAGGDFALLARDQGGNLVPTEAAESLVALVNAIRPALVILDPLSKMAGPAGIDSSNPEAVRFLSELERLVAASGGGSVLGVHHVNKASLGGKAAREKLKTLGDVRAKLEGSLAASAVRGASALTDNARWAALMTLLPESCAAVIGHSGEDHVAAFRVAKSNYSPTTATIFLRRQENGPLLPFQPVCIEEENLADQRETILAELSKGGPWTISAFEKAMKDHPFMPGRNAVRRALEFFVATGVVVERPGPRGAKHLEVVRNDDLTSPLASLQVAS